MICDFDRIDALVAGELSGEDRVSVLAHMENCPACRAYYETMVRLEGDETAPEGFTARVMDAVRATPQYKTRRPAWRSMAAVAACAVLVVSLTFGSGLLGHFVGADSAAPEAANDSVDMELARNTNGDDQISVDDGEPARDLPLTIHTAEGNALCAEIRAWLENQEIPELYPGGPREAYDLTADQVAALNKAVPTLALPEEFLQLELKDAE